MRRPVPTMATPKPFKPQTAQIPVCLFATLGILLLVWLVSAVFGTTQGQQQGSRRGLQSTLRDAAASVLTADVAAQANSAASLLRRPPAEGLYAMSVMRTNGVPQGLAPWAGQVSLVVNVASNYHGLQALYDKYRQRGFVVLAFPCDQFGHQEPGSLEDIQAFAKREYNVTFPIFPKVEVNGVDSSPIFTFLKHNVPGQTAADLVHSMETSWNFEKVLVGRSGMPVKRFGSAFEQADLERAIEAELDRRR